MENLATEIKAALYDRIGDKFFRSFMFLSLVHNWKILSAAVNLLFKNTASEYEYYTEILSKVSYVNFIYPLIGATIFIGLYPWIKMWIIQYSEYMDSKIINVRNEARKEKLLTEFESKELYKEVERANQINYQRKDFETDFRKLKEEFSKYYEKVMSEGFGTRTESGYQIQLYESIKYFRSGTLACNENGKLISLVLAEKANISLNTNNLVYVIDSFSNFSLAARDGSTILMFSKEYVSEISIDKSDGESMFISDFGEKNNIEVTLKKLKENIYKLSILVKTS